MTCIVGIKDEKTGIVYMGGDSLASNNYTENVINQRKVFKLNDTENAILGFSGMVRDLNLLRYAENLLDKRDEPNIDEKYIVTKFIPNVIRLFNDNGRNENHNGIQESESYFLLAYKDKLWKIEFNYAVLNTTNSYETIGSGYQYASGSLFTTEGSEFTITERIHKALQSASKFAVGVAPPFYIINTGNDEVVEFTE